MAPTSTHTQKHLNTLTQGGGGGRGHHGHHEGDQEKDEELEVGVHGDEKLVLRRMMCVLSCDECGQSVDGGSIYIGWGGGVEGGGGGVRTERCRVMSHDLSGRQGS